MKSICSIIKKTWLIALFFTFVWLAKINVSIAAINVATAANMKETAKVLAKEFFKKYAIKVNIISGASGNLYQQIINGAPFEVFISADTNYPNNILKNNYNANQPKIYAYGKLVIVVSNKDVTINNIYDINSKNIQHIAIANPKVAPYGKEAINILKKYNLDKQLKDKIVYAPSINAVNELTFSKAVDIAFTSKSALVLHSDNTIRYYEVPTNLYNLIPQAVVLIRTSNKEKAKEAELFFNFMFSKAGSKILENSGYIVK